MTELPTNISSRIKDLESAFRGAQQIINSGDNRIEELRAALIEAANLLLDRVPHAASADARERIGKDARRLLAVAEGEGNG